MKKNSRKMKQKIKIAKNWKKFLKSTPIHQAHNQQQPLNNKAKHQIKSSSNQETTKKCQPWIV